jgi:hypothetical protein
MLVDRLIAGHEAKLEHRSLDDRLRVVDSVNVRPQPPAVRRVAGPGAQAVPDLVERLGEVTPSAPTCTGTTWTRWAAARAMPPTSPMRPAWRIGGTTGSVIVDRTSRWGNPFAVGRPAGPLAPNPDEVVADRARAVALYRQSSYAAGKAGLWAAVRYGTDRPRSGVSLPGRGTVPFRGPARRRQPR